MINPLPLSLRRRLALEISRKQIDLEIIEHPLRQLFWECTLRCNLHCRHCGSDCKNISGVPDMPKEDFLRVLDGISAVTDPHKVFIIVTGGEPLMRADIEECGMEFYKRGFPWGMVSNGYALTKERYEKLLRAGMGSMTISLDGLRDDHTWMRQNPESFDHAVNAIKMLTATDGFIFDVVTCVNRKNYSNLEEIRDFLISIGVKKWRVFTVFPMGRAASDPNMRLSDEEFRGVFEFIRATRKEGKIMANYGCEGFLGNYEGEVRDHLFSCQAGISVGSVLIDGSISACSSIRSDYHQGNIYKDDFMTVWNTKFQPYRDRTWMKKDECANCSYFRYCRGGGMHLRDSEGKLLLCHLNRLINSEK